MERWWAAPQSGPPVLRVLAEAEALDADLSSLADDQAA
jgi:hypothetical protein